MLVILVTSQIVGRKLAKVEEVIKILLLLLHNTHYRISLRQVVFLNLDQVLVRGPKYYYSKLQTFRTTL